MRFPSKVTRIQDSIVYKMALIMERIENANDSVLTVNQIYADLQDQFNSIVDYVEALDCLFILDRIDITKEDIVYAK